LLRAHGNRTKERWKSSSDWGVPGAESLIERYVRLEQLKSRRRKPYGYRRRVIYL
jgi:hypothetical protein